MKKLRDCYELIKSVLGEEIEPYESVELVEKYRRYWKPDNVKTLLLAESHVFTTDLDRIIEIPEIDNLEGYPRQYAKFVYCLGYGERELARDPNHPAGDGTPQFWKIFYSCVNDIRGNECFASIQYVTPHQKRISNKINLLKELKSKGIWLVDTSIVALYNQGIAPPANVRAEVIKTSWEHYIKGVVKESGAEHIIIIGIGVAHTIKPEIIELAGSNHTVIAQPNARLTAAEHIDNYQKYYRLCQ